MVIKAGRLVIHYLTLSLFCLAISYNSVSALKLFIDYLLSREGQSEKVIFGRTASSLDVESVPPLAVLRQMKLFPAYPGIFDDYAEITSQFRNIFHKCK